MKIESVVPMAAKSLPQWVTISSKFAPYASTVVFMAPIPTIRKIMLDRNVGGLPLLPYSSMVANCVVWVVYGLLIKETKVWATNALGCGLGVLYCNEFRRYCPIGSAKLPGTLLGHLKSVSFIVMLTCFCALLFPVQRAASLVGAEGVFLCVLMFASPLATLKEVIETKSASSIPLPFTLACLLNCLLWSVVGWFEMNDFMIYAPNFLGFGCALAQVALKLFFKKAASDKHEDELELSANPFLPRTEA